MEKQLADQQSRYDKATLAAEGAGTEYDALTKEIDAISNNVTKAKLLKSQYTQSRNAISITLANLRSNLTRITKLGLCPTCGQTIKEPDQRKHSREIEREIALNEKERDALDGRLRMINASAQEERLSRLQENCQKFKNTFDQSMGEINLYQRARNEIRIKVATLKHTISELEANKNPYSEQVRSLVRQQTKLDGQRKDLKTDISKLNQRLERTRFWVKGFKDVQLYVVDEVLQELELVTNSMLPDIGLDDWKITYSVERETQSGNVQRMLNVLITSPSNEKTVSFKCWSGGEGQRLRIIGALALSDVLLNHAGVTANIEILDEPTRSLSIEGVNDLCPFLADRAQVLRKNVMYVDHMAIPSSEFSAIITIVKSKDGVSHVESV